jgi:para-aminobenzoate synthetase component I
MPPLAITVCHFTLCHKPAVTHTRSDQLTLIDLPYLPDSAPLAQRLAGLPGFIWLDSGPHRQYGGRFDLLSAEPCALAHALQPGHWQCNKAPIEDIAQWHAQQLESLVPGPADLPFCGGVMGYMGYEQNHPSQGLSLRPRFSTPLSQLGLYTWVVLVDHAAQRSRLLLQPQAHEKAEPLRALLEAPVAPLPHFQVGPFAASSSHAEYLGAIEQILAYLVAGDAYQVNLSQHFCADFGGSALAAYLALRQACPSPYGAFMQTAQGAILSLSPEQFIGITGDRAITRPIKGTAKRSPEAQEDLALAEGLRSSEKNQAENVMIVDLLRNDFGQHCLPGTVAVPELFGLHSFANVHHLVSTVTGQLVPGISPWSFTQAAFPGGSITGAPKKRAMQIIAELEPHQRHIYCGSIGYWGLQQSDTSIAIRTLLVEDQQVHIWGGGGVVADSQPQDEYDESLNKIRLLQATLCKDCVFKAG